MSLLTTSFAYLMGFNSPILPSSTFSNGHMNNMCLEASIASPKGRDLPLLRAKGPGLDLDWSYNLGLKTQAGDAPTL